MFLAAISAGKPIAVACAEAGCSHCAFDRLRRQVRSGYASDEAVELWERFELADTKALAAEEDHRFFKKHHWDLEKRWPAVYGHRVEVTADSAPTSLAEMIHELNQRGPPELPAETKDVELLPEPEENPLEELRWVGGSATTSASGRSGAEPLSASPGTRPAPEVEIS